MDLLKRSCPYFSWVFCPGDGFSKSTLHFTKRPTFLLKSLVLRTGVPEWLLTQGFLIKHLQKQPFGRPFLRTTPSPLLCRSLTSVTRDLFRWSYKLLDLSAMSRVAAIATLFGSSQTWLFQTWLFAIFALFCALLRSLRTCVCALLRLFALFCALLRPFACGHLP